MLKEKQTIEMRYRRQLAQLEKKIEYDYKKKIEIEGEKLREKLERQRDRKINRKRREYEVRIKNKIKELEGKKVKAKVKRYTASQKFEFCLRIAQQNAKLRQTDENGMGYCISCTKMCSWKELAGGHRYSRSAKKIALDKRNINAQCNTCNFTTGPRGDVIAKARINMNYDETLIVMGIDPKKLREDYEDAIKDTSYKLSSAEVEEKARELIEENKLLWDSKLFDNNINWDKEFEKYFSKEL